MKKFLILAVLVLVALVATSFKPAPVQAREACYGYVSGRVVDATGAGIPFVHISVRGVKTLTWSKDEVTGMEDPNAVGFFVVNGVKCGKNLTLKAKLDGRVVKLKIDVYDFGAFQYYELALP